MNLQRQTERQMALLDFFVPALIHSVPFSQPCLRPAALDMLSAGGLGPQPALWGMEPAQSLQLSLLHPDAVNNEELVRLGSSGVHTGMCM